MLYFSIPQLLIFRSDKQINLFLAGVGSGKTYLAGALSQKYIAEFPQCKGFIAANTYDQLNTATFFRIREFWKQQGIVEYEEKTGLGSYVVNKQPPARWDITEKSFISYSNIVTFKNGGTIFLGSLDNAKAHEGKEFAWAILDETKDTREDDVKDIILARLRQRGLIVNGRELNPLYILTSPAKTDWINQWFELDKDIALIQQDIYDNDGYFAKTVGNKFCTISSTYHNQANLPADYIDNKRNDWTAEKFKTLIYANPFSQTGAEYYSSFDRIKHVGKCEYNPEIPLHISFDFNYVPYNSMSVWQIVKEGERYKIYGIDEFALRNPNNSDEEVCRAFLARYQHRHKSGVYVYGDATGRAGTTLNIEQKHHIGILEKILKPVLNSSSIKIPAANPVNEARRDFANRLFEGKLPIDITIDERMVYMIGDMCYTKQDSITGSKDKHRVKDTDTGQVYEKYGHMGDNFEYFICEAFGKYFKKPRVMMY